MTALTILRWDDFDACDQQFRPHEEGGPFKFTLRWAMSGTSIGDQWCFSGDALKADPEVEEERFFFETGYFADKGCPEVEVDETTEKPLQMYRLFYDGVELQDGFYFSDYGIPNGAPIDVLLVRL